MDAASRDAGIQLTTVIQENSSIHHEIETSEDLKILTSAWKKYMENHPGASEKKQESFLNDFKKIRDSRQLQLNKSVRA